MLFDAPRRLMLILAAAGGLFAAGLAATASADTTRLLGDWTASCWTDQRRCAAETDAYERSGRRPYGVALSLSRRDGAETGWEIGFRLRDATPASDAVLTLTIDDGGTFRFGPGGYELTRSGRFVELTDGNEVARLLPALRAGGRVTVAFAGAELGETEANISLRGFAAALSWLDWRQDRVGSSEKIAAVKTVEPPAKPVEEAETAVEAPAGTPEPPAEAVKAPAAPAEPQAEAVEAPAEPGMAPERPVQEAEGPGQIPPGEAAAVPAAILARHLAKSECEPLEGGLLDSRLASAAALSDNKMLYVIPCFAGAYNIAYRLYVVRNGDVATMRTLYFANYSQSLGWYGSDTLINVSYEPEAGILRAFGKGRGLGDCGNAAVYRWEDFDFKMIEYRAWDRCDGSRPAERWPVIYKAKK
jgi:hypothetical protein